MAKNNNENTTAEGLTEEDLAAIAASFAEGDVPALTHTVLEIWENLLSNIEEARKERVTPVVANRIITNYPKLVDEPLHWNSVAEELPVHAQLIRLHEASKLIGEFTVELLRTRDQVRVLAEHVNALVHVLHHRLDVVPLPLDTICHLTVEDLLDRLLPLLRVVPVAQQLH